ncbi:putative tubby-like domain, gag-polypeptide of LTR copia-type [Rosa chinensis]|uniref:Putative tubby-like domain, gag-polypeptide of LTR copia-type n=1 Tax=Rosa chinensis TaxID=74649 RepID=A0A2P6R8J9_ROSCH|nr:putative tubby-like domain, gag-polypeptide of LTR copia-type [Rosa chinensis]
MGSPTQVCNSVPVRLDETNYPTWLYLMQHHLRGHGLLKFVDGSYPCPPQFPTDQDVKVLILAGLPSEYGHTRQIIRGKPNIDMEEVRSLLLSAEVEIELEHNSSPLLSLTALLAHSGILHNGNSSFNGASQGMQWNGSVGLPVPYNVSMPTFTSGLMMSNGSQPIFMMGNVNSVPNMTSSTGYISSPYVGRIQTPSSFVAQNGGNTNGMQQIYSGSQQLQNNSQNYYDGYSAQQFGSFSQNNNMQTQHSGGLTRLCSLNEGNYGSYSDNYSQGYPQFCNNKNSNNTITGIILRLPPLLLSAKCARGLDILLKDATVDNKLTLKRMETLPCLLMHKKNTVQSVLFGKDNFMVRVCPGIDYASIATLIVILDAINGDR